ncbi:MAG TPA: Glu/Leu/Phe/Val dehydrogenase [Phycisphaerales bacterium]|nr:Glu/Leu/Phe/Val dehydrogenase [Phycisphaerales bacterium]
MNEQIIDYSKIPDAPLFVCEINDPQYNLFGWLVIHTVGARGCCGGVRIYPDVTKREIELLAKGMTYKYCICKYALGGAKAGIRMSLDTDKRKRSAILQRFGQHIAPLIRYRIYHPWTDMNCSIEDMACIYKGAQKTMKVPPYDSAYFTALTTFSALLAMRDQLAIPAAQCKVTIEGFGKVGQYLAMEIVKSGSKVIGLSNLHGAVFNSDGLDTDSVIEAKREFGDAWVRQKGCWAQIPADQLHLLNMDIHIPCARTHSLTAEKANQITCKAVVPAANGPCSDEAKGILFSKGVTLLPYFVVNIGGIIGSGLAALGAKDFQVRDLFLTEHFQMISRLLQLSEQKQVSPVFLAKTEADKFYPTLVGSFFKTETKSKLLKKLRTFVMPSQKQLLKEKFATIKDAFNSRFLS